jgi:uncharacterized protein YfaP (DUF2135 family)
MKRMIMTTLLCLTGVALFTASLSAATVRITSPRNGYTTQRVQQISGTVENYTKDRITVIINGIPLTVITGNGQFSLSAVVAPGLNVIEAIAGDARDRVSFYAMVPGRDIKIVLTWDTPTDVDLWVIDPNGEKCYYAARSTKSGGNLDTDVTTGYGPETFTQALAQPGTYAVQVQYYGAYNIPVTRVNVYVVLYEGTPREQVKHFQFVMTREQQVYHISDFTIEAE